VSSANDGQEEGDAMTSVSLGAATMLPGGRIRKRRVVERPRLFAILDHSKARVRTLVAPAGYGKTTLAEQWVARDGRRGTWFTARSSATDVAALALGLARAATTIVEGCDERLREHLRALPAPAENVETLAEILGEDLAPWPASAWLVVDDYHEIAVEPLAEDFVKALIAASTVQFLVAGRQRPAWVSTKSLLYGDVLEVSQAALAMDDAEAAGVLVDRTASATSGLVALANGWPAVIGLAGVSSAEPLETDEEPVPAALYRFFAEEVFSALRSEVQQGLTTLSVAPVLDRELVSTLLGDETELVTTSALDVGILVERESRLDLHPLARAFLGEKRSELGLVPADGASEACLAHYRACRDWDAAFEVITRCKWPAELEGLVTAAIDELLESARLSTLHRWCDFAEDSGLRAPVFSIARAEILLRHGRHTEAIAHGESAAISSDHAFRALSIAGRAAHLASREEQALEIYRRAGAVATSERERREALWGQLFALVELERPESHETVTALRSTLRLADPRDVVRAAASGLSYQAKLSNLDLEEADFAETLLDRVRDPHVVAAFQSMYSSALVQAARYGEARRHADRFLQTARQHRLDFAIPYARASASLAAAGLRQWSDANAIGPEAINAAIEGRDAHAHQLCAAAWMRVLVQQKRHYEALAVEAPVVRSPLPAAHAGITAAKALVLAACGRISAARSLVEEVRGLSHAIEPTVLIGAVDAISALKSHDADAVDRVLDFERTAFQRGAVDVLVTAYRSTPELLGVLLKASGDGGPFLGLLRRVGDEDLATAIGLPLSTADDRRKRLSPREREVYELVVQRLTNREIAKLLFIEESTVKVHVHHIYDKLGVRSRLDLTVQATLERCRYATSAIVELSPGDSSS
jgi:DNA-binding NarL/FixJ family response regulator